MLYPFHGIWKNVENIDDGDDQNGESQEDEDKDDDKKNYD